MRALLLLSVLLLAPFVTADAAPCADPVVVFSGHGVPAFNHYATHTCTAAEAAPGVVPEAGDHVVPPGTSQITLSYERYEGVPSLRAHVSGRGLSDAVVELPWRADVDRYQLVGHRFSTDRLATDDVVVTIELPGGATHTSTWPALPR